MASSQGQGNPLNFPYYIPQLPPHFQPPPPATRPPPPPPHNPTPPPPHIRSPPPPAPVLRPPPPSPSPPNHTTVIVIVFVSCGGLFFLAFLAVALCCFVKKKKKKKKSVQKTAIVDVDEHLNIKEAIVEGPHGPQAVVLSVEDDVHIHEAIKKDEKAMHDRAKSKGGCVMCSHICCLVTKSNKKKKKMVEENEIVKFDEHLKVKEDVVSGHGHEGVVLSIEDDVHIEEEMIRRKNIDKFGQPATAAASST